MANQRGEGDEILSKISFSIREKSIVESIDISGKDLTFSEFSELMADRMTAIDAKLRASSFINASLRDSDFSSADMRNCNLDNIDIADCFFKDVNFNKSTMRFAKIKISFCEKACFDQVDLTNGDLYDTIFNGSTFRNAILTDVKAKYASFKDVDLSGANLTNGDFEGANFISSKLDGVIWTGANIIGARFDEGVLEKVLREL
ncbi:pentapeptide repeat-containing protein [Paenibacillus sp. VCA1]|uniref:pentapeptide repeat-containing protein n=1 Tax=Paenibacillus sp. VCA1 TaxID=3039148 RepID=UPI00287107D0|nr:pentapeptide repeat-containing protein [Paenibacillus sp. VCA1]MDR9856634.1 pentapeptide repeat-containing protein [Paenibacillus sp. VCA1]